MNEMAKQSKLDVWYESLWLEAKNRHEEIIEAERGAHETNEPVIEGMLHINDESSMMVLSTDEEEEKDGPRNDMVDLENDDEPLALDRMDTDD